MLCGSSRFTQIGLYKPRSRWRRRSRRTDPYAWAARFPAGVVCETRGGAENSVGAEAAGGGEIEEVMLSVGAKQVRVELLARKERYQWRCDS